MVVMAPVSNDGTPRHRPFEGGTSEIRSQFQKHLQFYKGLHLSKTNRLLRLQTGHQDSLQTYRTC